MPMSTGAMAALAFCACLVLVGIAIGIYFAVKGGEEDTTGTPPAPAPATDPRSTVWTTGQKLQGDPLEIGTAVVPLTTQPTLPTTATYSISMDLNVAETSPSWRTILTSKDGCDWDHTASKPTSNSRRPVIYIAGTDVGARVSQLCINHTDSGGNWQGDGFQLNGVDRTGADFTLGKWFNLTVTMDSASKTGKLYIDGTLKGNFTAPNAFAWASPVTTWTWGNTCYTDRGRNTQSIKVANAYFFQSVLTDAQVSKLVVPSAPTTGVPTTSYYTPEPYSDSGFMSY